jgi:hypothetical protein
LREIAPPPFVAVNVSVQEGEFREGGMLQQVMTSRRPLLCGWAGIVETHESQVEDEYAGRSSGFIRNDMNFSLLLVISCSVSAVVAACAWEISVLDGFEFLATFAFQRASD